METLFPKLFLNRKKRLSKKHINQEYPQAQSNGVPADLNLQKTKHKEERRPSILQKNKKKSKFRERREEPNLKKKIMTQTKKIHLPTQQLESRIKMSKLRNEDRVSIQSNLNPTGNSSSRLLSSRRRLNLSSSRKINRRSQLSFKNLSKKHSNRKINNVSESKKKLN